MKILKSTLPGAWICVNDPTLTYVNHGRKAVQHDKIYLKDGDEFEIELYNPMNENVLAMISLDGKPISTTGLVIRSGQRVYLDCFYDDKKKFVFRTYNVDGTIESQNAIAKNGLFEVQFFKEKILKKYAADTVHHHYWHHYNHYPYWNGYWNNGQFIPGFYYTSPSTLTLGTYNTGGTLTSGTTTVNNVSSFNATTSTQVNDSYNAGYNNLTFNNATGSASTYTSSLRGSLTNASNQSGIPISAQANYSASLETGQTDKGSESSQSFANVEMDFEDSILNKIVYQLLPESRQPRVVENSLTAKVNKIKFDAQDIEMNGNVTINGQSVGGSKVQQMLELKGMLKEGLITSQEFETLKKEIVS